MPLPSMATSDVGQPQWIPGEVRVISPSWCELQYWYALTKHGNKRRRPAIMETKRVEDAWGVRIWNIIMCLRELQETGVICLCRDT